MVKKVNVLYISYDGMTDPLGQSQVIPYLIGLSAHGYAFTLISAEKKIKFTQGGKEIRKILNEAGIEWHPVTYTKSPPILSTLYDYLKIKIKAYFLQKEKKFQIVHCRSYISSLIGLWMKKNYHVKFIFDMRGFWADERVDGNLWDIKNPIYKIVYDFFKKKEKLFLENADFTISLTYKAMHEIHRWKHITNNPVIIKVIPCCVDTELFNPSKINYEHQQILREKLGIEKNDFVLSYLGSIGTWYMLDEMLDFFALLKSKISNAKFLFITYDEHEKIIKTATKKNITKSDIIIRNANRNEVPIVVSISDFSIFFILPLYSKMSSSPTKQGEIMAMGIPVICNAGIGDTDDIVNKYDAGYIVHKFEYNQVLKSIIEKKEINKENIIKGAVEYFSLESGVQKYLEVYNRLF